MSVSFSSFLSQVFSQPPLLVTCLLLLAVMLVNGWTDAPNAIAPAVAAGALPFRRAAVLAAACNLLGVAWIAAVRPAVAETVYTIADFGARTDAALAALCAALCAVVLWATAAWRFGIPTSESHALIAGVTGAAAALQGGLSNVHPGPWAKVALGLILSLALGLWGGKLSAALLPRRIPCRRGLHIAGSAMAAALHGAQDGQKFLALFLLGAALSQGRRDTETFLVPLWLLILCGGCMGLGTLLGGRRIIDRVGRDMVPLTPRLGLAADLAGNGALLLCTLLGLPVSTTHVKTAAILGSGGGSGIQWRVVRSIVLTWLFTFPGCAFLGFLTARLFLTLFS